MIHALKTEPQYFEAVIQNRKPFEVRKNDRDFRVGDFLALNELDTKGDYTGRSVLLKLTYILTDEKYCKEGYAVLGFNRCAVISGPTEFSNPEAILQGGERQ